MIARYCIITNNWICERKEIIAVPCAKKVPADHTSMWQKLQGYVWKSCFREIERLSVHEKRVRGLKRSRHVNASTEGAVAIPGPVHSHTEVASVITRLTLARSSVPLWELEAFSLFAQLWYVSRSFRDSLLIFSYKMNAPFIRHVATGNTAHFKISQVIGRARILAYGTSCCTRSHQTSFPLDWGCGPWD